MPRTPQLTECAVDAASVSRLDLTGATLTDVEIGELRATEVVARNSRWRSVRMTGGRIGTFDLSGAELGGVELRGLRIDYLSLRGATATDILVADCVIGSIDLPLATLSRVAFRARARTRWSRTDCGPSTSTCGVWTRSTFTRPDTLRGTTLSESQVAALAVPLALAAGIDVRG